MLILSFKYIFTIFALVSSVFNSTNLITFRAKVSLDNFDFIVAPEHDSLKGKNVLTTKGAIHYLRNRELSENENYLKPQINKEKLATLIVGGPNKYYDYNDKTIDEIFLKIKDNFIAELEQSLVANQYLLGSKLTAADMAILPFIVLPVVSLNEITSV